MKKVSLFLSITLLAQCLTAQNDESPRYLSISGNAVIKAAPDSYMLVFWLEEYFEDCETGERKLKTIDEIFTVLKDKLKEYGLPNTEPTLLNVSSVDMNYNNQSKMYLRKSYGFSDSLTNYPRLLKVVENMRFKGLAGIIIRAEFSDPAGDQVAACKAAIDDASLKADAMFEKLHMGKGRILDVDFNNNAYYTNYNNDYDLYNQQGYRQFNFSMAPITVVCGVNVEYEIVNK